MREVSGIKLLKENHYLVKLEMWTWTSDQFDKARYASAAHGIKETKGKKGFCTWELVNPLDPDFLALSEFLPESKDYFDCWNVECLNGDVVWVGPGWPLKLDPPLHFRPSMDQKFNPLSSAVSILRIPKQSMLNICAVKNLTLQNYYHDHITF